MGTILQVKPKSSRYEFTLGHADADLDAIEQLLRDKGVKYKVEPPNSLLPNTRTVTIHYTCFTVSKSGAYVLHDRLKTQYLVLRAGALMKVGG